MALIVTVNLPGAISGRISHTSREKHTVKLDDGEYLTKMILHSNREVVPCTRITNISDSVASKWISNESPDYVDDRTWKKFSDNQKIAYYVSTLDEGLGATFEYLS